MSWKFSVLMALHLLGAGGVFVIGDERRILPGVIITSVIILISAIGFATGDIVSALKKLQN